MNAPAPQSGNSREDEVWRRLATVSDPELDESVADMGFVDSVELGAAGEVRIGFRLPTFWCAPNFAFLMAHDMRRAVESLPWVSRAIIHLADHCHAKEINRGVGAGLSFSDSFPGQAMDELDKLRATFRRKAFQRRQELLLRRLRTAGVTPENLCEMTMGELAALRLDDAETPHLRARYVEIRGEFGGPAAAEDLAFTTDTGGALDADGFAGYLQDLRRVRVNAEFNANMCRSILQTRYAGKATGKSDGKSTEKSDD
jgi:metal-sulfur cluster biosynthetic enzyme